MHDKYYKYRQIEKMYELGLENDQGAWVIKKAMRKYYNLEEETEEEKEARLAKEKIEFRESRLSQILDK